MARQTARARFRTGASYRHFITFVVLTVAAAWMAVVAASPAAADGPQTFSNTTAISVPATGSANQEGPAAPYPSTIAVSGLSGAISDVSVELHGVTHTSLSDVDAMLVAPDGHNLLFLSDVGGNGYSPANNADLTFSDSATGTIPDPVVPPSIETGTYKPTNDNGGDNDTFAAPAPAPSANTTFSGAFAGDDPNGTWSLYVMDDNSGDVGSIAGGWSLTITTAVNAASTVTTVSTSQSPATVGQAVTFTATVTSAGAAVADGTVSFTSDGTSLGAAVPVNTQGVATLTTSALAENTHLITATYSGTDDYLTSNASLTQVVDNATTVNGNTYCNTGPITIRDDESAVPYPSHITVPTTPGTIAKVTATINGLSHTSVGDVDVLLSSPTPATNVMLLSDVDEGNTSVNDLSLTFDDTAAGPVGSPPVSGTYKPTNIDTGSNDDFAPPAPAESSATALSTFDGLSPSGVWSLWVQDDASGDTGSISGGWCLTITPQPVPTTTTLTVTPNPSIYGQSVSLNATVTGSSPSGVVSFFDGAALLGTAALDSSGGASLVTSALTVGAHSITAVYGGDSGNVGSVATVLTQTVNPAVSAGGPYSVAEGGSLQLSGSGSGQDITWDLNGDGDFSDASGATPTLTWSDLEALGIDDGPAAYPVTAKLVQSGVTVTSTTQLTVTNTAPTVTITGPSTATAGVPLTLKIGADDPSPADAAATFSYTADWGDGSAVETVSGPADPPLSHTYASAGQYTATFTATDKDFGLSATGTLDVTVSPAEASTPGQPGQPGTPGQSGTGGQTGAASTPTTITAAMTGDYLGTGTLAYTGSDLYRQLGVALGLLGAGLLLTVFVRRRRS